MATSRDYRKQYLKWHRNYEVRAFRLLYPVFRKWGRSIDFSKLNEQNYSQLITDAVESKQLFDAYNSIYNEVGLLHGKRVGRTILKQFKFFNLGDFESTFVSDVMRWLLNEGNFRISTVEQSYIKAIRDYIAQGISRGDGIEDIARELEKLVGRRSFYRWQARRIARTEATAASNWGAMQAGNSSGVVMNKTWISATDSRTRRMIGGGMSQKFDHLLMNQQRVREDQPFAVPSNQGPEYLRFPGDPKGSPGNIINCRCTVALTVARDENGDFIFK